MTREDKPKLEQMLDELQHAMRMSIERCAEAQLKQEKLDALQNEVDDYNEHTDTIDDRVRELSAAIQAYLVDLAKADASKV